MTDHTEQVDAQAMTQELAATESKGKALLALAERCDAVTGPDRDLDGDIHCAVDGWRKEWDGNFLLWRYWRDGRWISQGSIPTYTASLDAALTLVPRGAGFNLDRYWIREGERWKVVIGTGGVPENPRRVFDCWDAYTAPLATCVAALRARALDAPDRTE